MSWKKLSSKIIYKNKWFYVSEDQTLNSQNKPTTYSTFTITDDIVYVAAVDQDKKVHLVEQYRYPIQENSWELVAGHTDNDEPVEAAKRELLEEAGIEAANYTKLGRYYIDKGLSGSGYTLYLATELSKVTDELDQEDGIIQTKKFTEDEINTMVANNTLKDAHTIAALYVVFEHLRKGEDNE